MRNSMQKNTKKIFHLFYAYSIKAIERSFFRFTGLITHFENTQRARYFHEVSPKPRFYASRQWAPRILWKKVDLTE